ncbi:TetR/AcrR family transcriptional regulator [Shewanella insulae]|uniref:TetR/AcrR family transcriptional regulator n=1 Tax=Shewanella insulae TaxID=2681496 RepID=UPI001EFCBA99|nr:TetR/AcrR family transcriptional regulator [Shewanella insulae]MCG9712557.1 TetR/AcrR family transcriptional regulator [Shewanella insulae]
MSSWEQREAYLVEVALRCLRGHKTFDLCRSHLVPASQISKGTIYNHFGSEADLIVAVACSEYRQRLQQAQRDSEAYSDPLALFLFHHCNRLYEVLSQQRFVIERVMPNQEILEQASEDYRRQFETLRQAYLDWNRQAISAVGDVAGFNRLDLVVNYLRGAMINTDDANQNYKDPKLYYQFSYAISHLMGHSDKRIPSKQAFARWLEQCQHLEANAAA